MRYALQSQPLVISQSHTPCLR
uniref:Uncharacterized protein n=1 Tax=Rhizophora mucronata TaxID=61149 RepID=A0A2P2N405_RHIMU